MMGYSQPTFQYLAKGSEVILLKSYSKNLALNDDRLMDKGKRNGMLPWRGGGGMKLEDIAEIK